MPKHGRQAAGEIPPAGVSEVLAPHPLEISGVAAVWLAAFWSSSDKAVRAHASALRELLRLLIQPVRGDQGNYHPIRAEARYATESGVCGPTFDLAEDGPRTRKNRCS
jgi:hypothetical protein